MPTNFTNGTRFDDKLAITELVMEKFTDAGIPGAVIEFSPEEAEVAGAFDETALEEEEAADSVVDLVASKDEGMLP